MRGLDFREMFGYFLTLSLLVFQANSDGGIDEGLDIPSHDSVIEIEDGFGKLSNSVSDSLLGSWDVEIRVTNIRTPSDTCSIGGGITITALGPLEVGQDHGRAVLKRLCQEDGQARELAFEGPVSIDRSAVTGESEVWIAIPECRLRVDRLEDADGGRVASGFARCVVQEMREPLILEGDWEMVRQPEAAATVSRETGGLASRPAKGQGRRTGRSEPLGR